MAKFAVCVAALVACTVGASVRDGDDRVALEADVDIVALSRGWVKQTAAPKDALLRMTFAVKQQNLAALTDTLMRVSNPKHVDYGKHLTKEGVDQLVQPSPESVRSVMKFLEASGVTNCESSGSSDFVHCTVTVATAEAMLNTEYFSYSHTVDTAFSVIRADQHYTVPRALASHLDFVSPTNRFPPVRAKKVQALADDDCTYKSESACDAVSTCTWCNCSAVPSACWTKKDASGLPPGVYECDTSSVAQPDAMNTPESLRKLYSVGDVEGTAQNNKVCATAFLNQFYKQSDLDKFWKTYYPKATGRTIKVIGPDKGSPGIEASLDIEYISTMGGGVPAEFWSFAGSAPTNPENEPFLTWIYLVANTSDADVPYVFSTSYGEPEDTVSMAYMNRIEAEFQKTGARGITLFFATGDSGVTPDAGSCTGGRFAGQWPAGSPWVTGVGGTESGLVGGEKAWGGSAGGFSDRWARPSFQADVVSKYLSSGVRLPDASHYNSTSRAFPDVSAQATNFLVINGGFTEPVAGTSCASPTFGGLFSLLNDLRLNAGKKTLGWANPFFYQNPDMFNDITEGSNEAGPGCGPMGFEATKGWDPVTGLGSPNYAKMKEAVMALP
eukprot:m.411251 g.411251  ORF g.411251 m.411251 type:complete len:612 (-) comp28606_c0_seq1:105-1940(-)